MEAVYGLETTGVLLNARFSEMMVRREVNEEQQITENDRKELAEAQEWYAQEQFLATLVSTLQETTARIISQIPTTQQHHVNILQRIEKRSTQKRESRTRWMASGNFQNFRVALAQQPRQLKSTRRPRCSRASLPRCHWRTCSTATFNDLARFASIRRIDVGEACCACGEAPREVAGESDGCPLGGATRPGAGRLQVSRPSRSGQAARRVRPPEGPSRGT
ncbi:uncharacterized protein LOC126380381 isoform X1 [Pectinophora gossypiella]|uniref:uncharacterized protein LOC126380381 isoform X1 n=1 Tax=Pectinophora gossypiella TaxID=13191 RepID=UPI00214ED5D3|nr:uncharacterized protein LOC126380381 isoform X1 [Pectinophora gossypiella]